MLVAQGAEPQFPMVENEKINFMRNQEFEAKLSLTQPIYYPSIAINKRIEERKLRMTETEIEQYKNELTFQIKESYYNYNKALKYFDLIQETKDLVNENYRVTQKLLENNMINKDAVLRAKSEISKIELYETDAIKNKEMAKSYFNFLLNRNLDEEIIVASNIESYLTPEYTELSQNAIDNREELKLLSNQINIMDDVAKLSGAAMLPKFLVAIDYGIQGEKFDINKDSDFITGSFVLTWDLFSGNLNRNKKKQAIIQKQKLNYYKDEVSNRIQLEVKQNVYDLEQQLKNLSLARTRQNEAVEVYRIVEKRYRLGEATLIELLDVRNNLTEAEAQLIITKYDYLISVCKLEKSSRTSLSM
jgi:outer membrane protein TolC